MRLAHAGRALRTGTVSGLALLVAVGCHVDTHRNGDYKDVKIDTPFGGMSVKTDDASVQQAVGLSVYPGATVLKKDKDNGAADVNIGIGNFRLSVKAVSYETPDPPDKVLAFYRRDMARYGIVILCRNDVAVGQPDHTPDGLTCEHDHSAKVHVSEDEQAGEELKAGSKQHQHIVGIDPMGSGSKIGLVALELPGRLGSENETDKQ